MGNILAVDIGGSKLMAGIITRGGEIIRSESMPLPSGADRDYIRGAVTAAVHKVSGGDLIGTDAAGVNIPGLADVKAGIWVHAPFSGISDFPVVSLLEEEFRIPVYIENDVNACAVAEKMFGCCRDTDDYIWVTVSNGIGGALVTDGKLYTGARGNAGEIGHITVEEDGGFLCGCGKHGCLEAMAAGPGIGRLYCMYAALPEDGSIKSKQVGEKLRMGDPAAKCAFDKAGYYIGKALAAAANLMNPEKIVLGGGVMYDYELLRPSLFETFEKMLFKKANPDITIEKTALGYDAALIGAASVAITGLKEKT